MLTTQARGWGMSRSPRTSAVRVEWGRARRPATSELLWHGACRSRFAVPTFAVFVVAGLAVGLTVGAGPGLLVILAGLPVLTLVEIHVEVTDDAVRVRYSGPLRWPTTRLRRSDVLRAEAIEIDPLRHGGWGYRGSVRLFRRAAVNLRRGPGLRFELADDRVFLVTVDGAGAAIAAGLSGSREVGSA
jgi:hypothetical protein